jgi:hypothetical protein
LTKRLSVVGRLDSFVAFIGFVLKNKKVAGRCSAKCCVAARLLIFNSVAEET